MQQVILRIVLDAGAQEIWSMLTSLIGAALVVLLVALFLPLVLVATLLGGAPNAPPPTTSTPAEQSAQPSKPVPVAPRSPDGGEALIVDIAHRYLGIPYVFGGTDPRRGLDCSGLVQLVFHQVGINLPRTAQQQFDATPRIPRDQLQPGDLVFFARTYANTNDWITHVGIYIGNGQQINAPTEGQSVSIQPVFTGFWGSHFAGGGRP